MPYHGVRPCKCGKYGTFEFVRDCGATGILKCNYCGRARRVKWSYYIRRSEFENKALKEPK